MFKPSLNPLLYFVIFCLVCSSIPLKAGDAPPPTLPPKDGRWGGTGKWTMYYIHAVDIAEKDNGVTHTVILLTGEKMTIQMTAKSSRVAKVEAAAAMVDKTGKLRVGALVGNIWQELPEGAFGIGNRKNPLVPWVHVAADQSLYPFESRVFMPKAVGYVTPEGKVLNGYFWVGDTGSAIKGRLRFDLFVGHDKTYTEMMSRLRLGDGKFECYVEKPPTVPDDISPTTPQGMHELLIRTGCLKAPGVEGFSPHAFMVIPDEMRDALIVFQKRYADIPPAEYGNPLGATTMWYLSKAAQDLSKNEAAK